MIRGREQIPFDWLWDTPLFIASERIGALYHSVALPETEEEFRTITDKVVRGRKFGGEVGAEGSGDVGSGFLGFLPKLAAKANVNISGERTKEQEAGTEHPSAGTLSRAATASRLFVLCRGTIRQVLHGSGSHFGHLDGDRVHTASP